jgi:hypothetical protein
MMRIHDSSSDASDQSAQSNLSKAGDQVQNESDLKPSPGKPKFGNLVVSSAQKQFINQNNQDHGLFFPYAHSSTMGNRTQQRNNSNNYRLPSQQIEPV